MNARPSVSPASSRIDVIDVLSDLFILRGVPAHERSDNGPEFVVKAVQDWIAVARARYDHKCVGVGNCREIIAPALAVRYLGVLAFIRAVGLQGGTGGNAFDGTNTRCSLLRPTATPLGS
jgi:hypothetical protein